MWYGRDSCFLWTDAEGVVHEVWQGEGGEQGDPLMPALYALAQHDSLARARSQLHPNDFLLAFLDDLYSVTSRSRARAAFDIVPRKVSTAGVQTHTGKLRLWSSLVGNARMVSVQDGPAQEARH